MKLFVSALLFGLLPYAQAVKSLKSVVVTYPKDTPDSVINSAKDVLVQAGGIITHEYQLIKGFAAKASVNAIESMSALSTAYNPYIEEDKVVTINGKFDDEPAF